MKNINRASLPGWYDDDSMTAWDRVRETVRREWEQAKHRLAHAAGHDLDDDAMITPVRDAPSGAMPASEYLGLQVVSGAWEEVEYPIGYGYAARRKHATEHPIWNEGIEQRLRSEWEARHEKAQPSWSDVGVLVRYGYEHALRS